MSGAAANARAALDLMLPHRQAEIFARACKAYRRAADEGAPQPSSTLSGWTAPPPGLRKPKEGDLLFELRNVNARLALYLYSVKTDRLRRVEI